MLNSTLVPPVCRSRAHVLIDQLRRDGVLAVREALRYEACQEHESADKVGKSTACGSAFLHLDMHSDRHSCAWHPHEDMLI